GHAAGELRREVAVPAFVDADVALAIHLDLPERSLVAEPAGQDERRAVRVEIDLVDARDVDRSGREAVYREDLVHGSLGRPIRGTGKGDARRVHEAAGVRVRVEPSPAVEIAVTLPDDVAIVPLDAEHRVAAAVG